MSNKLCNICYEEKNKNKFFNNYGCGCANSSLCSECLVKLITVCGDCSVFHLDCPFCKKHCFFDYNTIEKFTKPELYILINKYMEALEKKNNLINHLTGIF